MELEKKLIVKNVEIDNLV